MSQQQYDNTNRFVLFKNEQKDDDRKPDYSGTLNVDGSEYFIDGWVKTTNGGKKLLSGKIKLKQKKQSARNQGPDDWDANESDL